MPTPETAPRDDSPGLSTSRAEFASSLHRRLDSALAALSEFQDQPASPERRDNFLRRIHALRASAKVLGFAAASEILTHAEQQIRTCPVESPAEDVRAVRAQLENLPSLVLRGAYSLAPPNPPSQPPKSLTPLISEPLAIVVWGTPDFLDTVRSIERSTNSLEVLVVQDPDELRSACAAVGPDVLLLDANQGSITLLVDDLIQAPETSTVPILVANVPDAAAPGLLELGVRLVLPVRASEHQISHALFQVRNPPERRTPSPVPLGDITLKDLAEHLAQEIRQALVDSAAINTQSEPIPLGDGTSIRAALWSALAQIRDQLVDATGGRLRFTSGPEGATPLAPRSSPTARARTIAGADTVDLTGRRMLVVDDDPAVAWFVGATLRAVGAVVTEVHDGAEALQLAYRLWPELIVSDIMMPGLDGFALCHALKLDVLLRDLPIILLSWKEDLLFRLRDLGANADGYLRKEANASTIVRRVKELLLPRSALERRLAIDQESRGRLDGTTTRLLLELAAALQRPVRIALRDATAVYDLRLQHGTLAAATRTRHDGTIEHGESTLGSLMGITAARFSVVTDREPCEPMFSGSLSEILQPSVLRARAAQRLLSGSALTKVDRLTIAPSAFGAELPPLPLSLRPIADELLRGTPPRQLLATGVASAQLLESLLSDVARRGAVRSIEDVNGQDLLEREILLLQAKPAVLPPKPASSQPPPQFTFQLSPSTPEVTTSDPPVSPVAPPFLQTPALPIPEPKNTGQPTSREPPPTTHSGLDNSRHGEHDDVRQPSLEPIRLERDETPKPHAEPIRLDHDETHVDQARDDRKRTMLGIQPATSVLAPISLLPHQFTVTSNPPPSDDIDWAMELSWDTTPPPSGNAPAGPVRDAPRINPPESATRGFLRPAIPTHERGSSMTETPDLASAVARAVSEATPSPPRQPSVVPSAAENQSTPAKDRAPCVSPSPNPVADTTRESDQGPTPEGAAPVNLTTRKDSGALSPRAPANRTDRQLDALPADAVAHAPAFATASPTPSPSLAAKEPDQEPQPTFNLRKHPFPAPLAVTASAPKTASLPAAGAGPIVDSPQLSRLVAAASFVDARSQPPEAVRLTESPTVLPAVYQPPRPKYDNVLDVSGSDALIARAVEEPVFPLVSTSIPSPAEIHPSADVGAPTTSQDRDQAAAIGSIASRSTPAHPRDTLRSPSAPHTEPLLPTPAEAQQLQVPPVAPEPAEPLLLAPAEPTEPLRPPPEAPQVPPQFAAKPPDAPNFAVPACTEATPVSPGPERARTLPSPTDHQSTPRSIASRSAPPSSAPPVVPSRHVGWVQAFGLATLAGIVTFAVTVPIASWIHRRQRPTLAEPPVAPETLPLAPSASGPSESIQPLTNKPLTSPNSTPDSDFPQAAPSSPERSEATPQPGSPVSLQEIPVPPNVTLKPAEAVLEINTGGDHAIFVDDVFVGRGPIRVVPVASGRHVVRTRLNGTERSDPVEVGAGRALRVSLEQAWK